MPKLSCQVRLPNHTQLSFLEPLALSQISHLDAGTVVYIVACRTLKARYDRRCQPSAPTLLGATTRVPPWPGYMSNPPPTNSRITFINRRRSRRRIISQPTCRLAEATRSHDLDVRNARSGRSKSDSLCPCLEYLVTRLINSATKRVPSAPTVHVQAAPASTQVPLADPTSQPPQPRPLEPPHHPPSPSHWRDPSRRSTC